MVINIYTARATANLPGRLFVVTEEDGVPKTLYEFVDHRPDDGGEHLTFTTCQSLQGDADATEAGLTDEVRQALGGAGYTVTATDADVEDGAETDGCGSPSSADSGGSEPAEQRRPPEDVRWLDDDRAVLALELTRPLVEWIELEVAQHDFDSIADWALTQIQVNLTRDLRRRHGFEAAVDIDLPEDYAARAELYYNHLEQLGSDSSPGDIVFNHMQFRPTWRLEGEPWELAERTGENPPRGGEEEGGEDDGE